MSSNDRIMLDELLSRKHANFGDTVPESEFFEQFAAEQYLKDRDLNYDQIESGLVGGGNDGGVDGIYLFVDDELIQEEEIEAAQKKNPEIELVLIQAKTSSGFAETPIERFITFSRNLLDLAKPLDELKVLYNPSVIEAIERFQSTMKQLVDKFPTLSLKYVYVTKGDKPSESVKEKSQHLCVMAREYFSEANIVADFLGAPGLLAIARRAPQQIHTLKLAENPISSAGESAFVCLVEIKHLHQFLSDDEERLRRNLFEANVRDYQGKTEVNDQIQSSLKVTNQENFWWLNNGITILATKASSSQKLLTLEDPQIVNGLQTSTEVYNYFNAVGSQDDQRTILVRVIVPDQAGSRERIIKATNSQTYVNPASLRATDTIHTDIEEYLLPRGLYYDRRKNFYKNEGKPRGKIVGIPHLAQAVMSVVLQRPSAARSRPTSLLKKNEEYERIFSNAYPIHLYYVCATLLKSVETYLKSDDANLEIQDRNNLKFYVAMHLSAALAVAAKPTPKQIADIDSGQITDMSIATSLKVVRPLYENLGGNDKVSKGPELVEAVRNVLGSAV